MIGIRISQVFPGEKQTESEQKDSDVEIVEQLLFR
jgi:hypothetical protein